MSDANISLVQDLYAAFARGDVSTILSACAPDVDWRLVGRKDDYPTFGAWQGPGEVEKFFQLVSNSEDFQDFSPREFHGSGDKVFVLGFYSLTIKKTGRSIASEWCHVFTIRAGKVAAFREFTRHRAGRGGLPRLNSTRLVYQDARPGSMRRRVESCSTQ